MQNTSLKVRKREIPVLHINLTAYKRIAFLKLLGLWRHFLLVLVLSRF